MIKTENLPVIFLKPGEFHFSRKPEMITTILGSCVALILFDTITKTCAVTHCVLPEKSATAPQNNDEDFKMWIHLFSGW